MILVYLNIYHNDGYSLIQKNIPLKYEKNTNNTITHDTIYWVWSK